MTHSSPASRAVVVLLGALAAFGPLATDMYLPAFAAIGAELAAPPAALQRTLATFFAGMGVGQLLYGPLSDRFGRRRPLLAGVALFGVASVGCALAGDAGWLAMLRLAQGLGGCAGMVIARAVVRDLAEGAAAVRLMARLMLVMGAAPILAPTLGGAVLLVTGWRGIFALLAAYAALLLLLVPRLLPETLPPERRRHGGVGQAMATYATLLRDRRFLAPALSGALPMAGMFAYIAGSPFVFLELFGFSPTSYALLFGLNALGLVLASQAVAQLAARVPPARALWWAQACIAAAGLVLLAATALGAGPMTLAACVFLCVAPVGAALPLAGALAMQPYPRTAGSASALLGALQFGSGAVMGAALGLLADGTALPMGVLIAAAGLLAPALRAALRG